MILTLASIKQSSIPRVLNLCVDDRKVLQFVNEAQERLMSTKKDWLGTWQSARFMISGGCVTWPRGVLEIRNAKICGQPVVLRNSWYEYIQPVGEPYASEVTGSHFVLQDYDQSPVHTNIKVSGSTIRLFPASPTDITKRVLVQGYDAINGVFVRTQDTDGQWVDGEYVTLESPFADTLTQWAENGITGIQKSITDQPVTMFEVDANLNMTEMASYAPDEAYPSFKRSRILHYQEVRRRLGEQDFSMECIVKRAHIPVRVDTDYLVLQNLGALKAACMAVKKEEDQNVEASVNYWRTAELLLRGELENNLGRKMHISADYHGGKTFRNSVMSGFR